MVLLSNAILLCSDNKNATPKAKLRLAGLHTHESVHAGMHAYTPTHRDSCIYPHILMQGMQTDQ